jgi:hypothetical protein
MQPGNELDFFIGHAAKDSRAAEKLYSLLIDRATVFLDSKSLRLGQNWDVAVRDAQMKAAITVILVSKATDEAFYQREEIARSIAHAREAPSRHTVIPVFLDRVQDLGSLPYGLVTLHGLAISRSLTMADAANKLMNELSWMVRKGEDFSRRQNGDPEFGDQYGLDLCLCVDIGPEAGEFLEVILGEVLKFPYLLMGNISMKGHQIGQVRVRTLTFGADVDTVSMQDGDSGFYEFPQRAAEASAQSQKLLRARQPVIQSRALIALEKAIRSRWCDTFPRVLHVIAIWSACVPQADKAALGRLKELWEDHGSTGLSPTEKRLVIFAPQGEIWEYISDGFENAVWRAGSPGSTKPTEFDDIMKALAMDLRPEEPQEEHTGRLSAQCIHMPLSPDELRDQIKVGGQQKLTEGKRWITGLRLLAGAKQAGERMPILFSDIEGRSDLIYWAIIDEIAIDDQAGTTCLYSDLREIKPVRHRSELRLRQSGRPLSSNSSRSHAICNTPGFLTQDQLPNAN